MLATSRAYSSFAVDDLAAARDFYTGTLGLQMVDVPDMGPLARLQLASDGADREVLVYESPGFSPASYTILNFPVPDVAAAVDQLVERGVVMLRYDDFAQDERGVLRGTGPAIAWFADPAGNVLSVVEG